MNKKLCYMLCCALFVSLLGLIMQNAMATSEHSETPETRIHPKKSGEKIYIMATSFHEYDWLRQIIGKDALEETEGNISLTLLIDNGIDLHSFEPTIQDVRMILASDLFIYNGGNSNAWVKDIIKLADSNVDHNLDQTKLYTFNVMDVIAREVKVAQHFDHAPNTPVPQDVHGTHDHSTCTDPSHNHEHDNHVHEAEQKQHKQQADEHEHLSHLHHADEHIWLSLKNAMLICQKLCSILTQLDPENQEVYLRNTQKYIDSLNALHEKFQEERKSFSRDTIIIADRFPFVYMLDDYGINYFAAFSACSAETEASFQTVVFLTNKLNELKSKNIFILENGLKSLALTIVQNSNEKDCAILELNSMQSILKEDIEAGLSYYEIMEKNLEVLKSALRQ